MFALPTGPPVEYYSEKDEEQKRIARSQLIDRSDTDENEIFQVKCKCGLDTIVIGKAAAERYCKRHNYWCDEAE